MSEVKDIFISYSNRDKDKVEKIVSAIQFFGASCWFQLRDSRQHFIEEINEGINNSSNFVVFLSDASVNSMMVRNEITRAIHQQSKVEKYAIVPVVVEDLSPQSEELIKLFLGSLNWVYASKYDDYDSLVLAIFDQANITIQHDENAKSAYSTEKEVEKLRLHKQNVLFNAHASKHIDAIWSKYENPVVLRKLSRNYRVKSSCLRFYRKIIAEFIGRTVLACCSIPFKHPRQMKGSIADRKRFSAFGKNGK